MDRSIITGDEIRENVYISIAIFESKILVQLGPIRPMGSFNTCTFHVGVLADQKLNDLSLQ